MLAVTALVALLRLASVRADPTPVEPSANSVFNEGGQCTIQWTPDPTGVWKVMNIELMTGSNLQMIHLRTVGTVDATSTTNNSYSYPCLAVEPNSQIYFYQFTCPASTNVLWTTRFTIADASGKSVPPTQQETNAAGEIIRYGTGKLEDPSLADTPPGPNTNGTSSAFVNSTSIAIISTTAPSNVTTPTAVLLTNGASTTDGSNSNRQGASVTLSSTTPSQQSQKGGAVSYQRTAGVGILATAIFCGSLLL